MVQFPRPAFLSEDKTFRFIYCHETFGVGETAFGKAKWPDIVDPFHEEGGNTEEVDLALSKGRNCIIGVLWKRIRRLCGDAGMAGRIPAGKRIVRLLLRFQWSAGTFSLLKAFHAMGWSGSMWYQRKGFQQAWHSSNHVAWALAVMSVCCLHFVDGSLTNWSECITPYYTCQRKNRG